MATWDDVRRIATAGPETAERSSQGLAGWRVKDKGFVWERPLRRAGLEALGDAAPDGRIGLAELDELIVEAWLVPAPKRVARAYLDAAR